MKRTALSLAVVLGMVLPAMATSPFYSSTDLHSPSPGMPSYYAPTFKPQAFRQPSRSGPILSTALPANGPYQYGVVQGTRPTGITSATRPVNPYAIQPLSRQRMQQHRAMLNRQLQQQSFLPRPAISARTVAQIAMWRGMFGGVR